MGTQPTSTRIDTATSILATGRKPISPAFVILVCLWAISLLVLFALGPEARNEAWQDLLIPAILLGLAAITRRLNPAPTEELPRPSESRTKVRPQLLVIAAIILLTAFQYFVRGGIPVWSTLANLFARLGAHTPASALGTTNFGQYALIPGIAVLVLGARLGQVGLGRFGPAPLRIAIVWLLLPAAALGYAIYAVIRMHKAAWFILSLFVQNLFQNGISEEFLWRGLLLTRMRGFLRDDWANLVQALLFGAWHFRYDYRSTHGHLVYAVAAMIASQVVFGYAMGWLFLKTRNLVIPSVFHAAFDTMGSVFS